ncbi:hypothetical protein GCM10010406_13240 [Streptomyces thermolineatus]|uniref:Uncharacterized protein n=1 Tax=Streptomyces thermolineatus TaxID=44033 RepID=A0ABN3L605_9ACTN
MFFQRYRTTAESTRPAGTAGTIPGEHPISGSGGTGNGAGMHYHKEPARPHRGSRTADRGESLFPANRQLSFGAIRKSGGTYG